jgi:hypothetical protein
MNNYNVCGIEFRTVISLIEGTTGCRDAMHRVSTTASTTILRASVCDHRRGCPKSQSRRHCERSEAIRNTVNHWIASGCAFAMTGLDPFWTPSINLRRVQRTA